MVGLHLDVHPGSLQGGDAADVVLERRRRHAAVRGRRKVDTKQTRHRPVRDVQPVFRAGDLQRFDEVVRGCPYGRKLLAERAVGGRGEPAAVGVDLPLGADRQHDLVRMFPFDPDPHLHALSPNDLFVPGFDEEPERRGAVEPFPVPEQAIRRGKQGRRHDHEQHRHHTCGGQEEVPGPAHRGTIHHGREVQSLRFAVQVKERRLHEGRRGERDIRSPQLQHVHQPVRHGRELCSHCGRDLRLRSTLKDAGMAEQRNAGKHDQCRSQSRNREPEQHRPQGRTHERQALYPGQQQQHRNAERSTEQQSTGGRRTVHLPADMRQAPCQSVVNDVNAFVHARCMGAERYRVRACRTMFVPNRRASCRLSSGSLCTSGSAQPSLGLDSTV